jgi:hypothetical protein
MKPSFSRACAFRENELGGRSPDDLKVLKLDKSISILFAAWFLCFLAFNGAIFGQTVRTKNATVEEISAFFKGRQKTVLTFIGYSGAGYEDELSMRKDAERILSEFDPAATIVNIGATPDGIGVVYEIAKRKGFITTGIVSSQARKYNAELSTHVDHVFYVEDATWGGFMPGTNELSPTSSAMVENSDVIIGIGGGEVARDELVAAKRLGKKVRFIPADMNHQKGRETARKKKMPEPTDFSGAANEAMKN